MCVSKPLSHLECRGGPEGVSFIKGLAINALMSVIHFFGNEYIYNCRGVRDRFSPNGNPPFVIKMISGLQDEKRTHPFMYLILYLFWSIRRSAFSLLSSLHPLLSTNSARTANLTFHCAALRQMVAERGCPASGWLEDIKNDRITFEWTNALEGAAKQFQ